MEICNLYSKKFAEGKKINVLVTESIFNDINDFTEKKM